MGSSCPRVSWLLTAHRSLCLCLLWVGFRRRPVPTFSLFFFLLVLVFFSESYGSLSFFVCLFFVFFSDFYFVDLCLGRWCVFCMLSLRHLLVSVEALSLLIIIIILLFGSLDSLISSRAFLDSLDYPSRLSSPLILKILSLSLLCSLTLLDSSWIP